VKGWVAEAEVSLRLEREGRLWCLQMEVEKKEVVEGVGRRMVSVRHLWAEGSFLHFASK